MRREFGKFFLADWAASLTGVNVWSPVDCVHLTIGVERVVGDFVFCGLQGQVFQNFVPTHLGVDLQRRLILIIFHLTRKARRSVDELVVLLDDVQRFLAREFAFFADELLFEILQIGSAFQRREAKFVGVYLLQKRPFGAVGKAIFGAVFVGKNRLDAEIVGRSFLLDRELEVFLQFWFGAQKTPESYGVWFVREERCEFLAEVFEFACVDGRFFVGRVDIAADVADHRDLLVF